MSPRKSSDEEETRARRWSPETETREEVKALLRRRSALDKGEVLLFRMLYPEIYDTYLETLRYVVRCRGATGAVEMELVHDALTDFWNETASAGFAESIQARLISLASNAAYNHVRRESRNPATQALPTSSKEAPGSFPALERKIDMREQARLFFSKLSVEHRAVVDAVVLRDRLVTEAARELGLERTTAGSRLTAALALLNEMAEELLTESERRL
jgi:DNA-directed RNA polymerase specialized sigma24 family protein